MKLHHQSVPCVECSRDGGLTWAMWNYWRSSQERECLESKGRLVRLYPEFRFRVAWAFVCKDEG